MSDRRSLILGPAKPGADTAKQWRQYRYNPIASATPASLTRALDEFESGWLRSAALLWEAICDRDDIARPCSIKRVGAVSTRPFDIVRTEESPEAERHEAALRYFFDNLTVTSALDLNVRGTFSDLTEQMMSAQLMQYAAHEILWQPGARDEENRPAMTAELRFVPLYLFENTSGRLRYTGPQSVSEGAPLEDGGWMTTVGDGIMKAVSVAWMFKRLSLSDWLQYSEKFGIPGIHGTTPAQKGTPEFTAFVDALEAFASDWVMASAQGSEVKLIEVGKTGDAPFSPMVERMDRQIAILMLGSDLATLSRDNGTGASLQGEETSALFARDCKKISSTLQTQLARPVIEYLFGPGVRPLAYIEIAPPQQQNIDQDIKIDDHLAKNGIDQDPAELAARYGRSLPEGFGEDEEGNEATRHQGNEPEDDAENEELENAFNPSQPRGKNGRWVKLSPGDKVIREASAKAGAARGAVEAPPKMRELQYWETPDAELARNLAGLETDRAGFRRYVDRAKRETTDPATRAALDQEYESFNARVDAMIRESKRERGLGNADDQSLRLPPSALRLREAIAQDLSPAYDAIATALQAADSDLPAALEKLNADWEAITDRVLDGSAADAAMESVLGAAFLSGLGLGSEPLLSETLANAFNPGQPRDGSGRWTNSKGEPVKFTGEPMPPPDEDSCLEGTCVSESQITDAVGGLDEFEKLIAEKGDAFDHAPTGTRVTFNPKTREHFFWRKRDPVGNLTKAISTAREAAFSGQHLSSDALKATLSSASKADLDATAKALGYIPLRPTKAALVESIIKVIETSQMRSYRR